MSLHKDIKRITTHVLQEMKQNGEKISMLTAYDYSMAQIVDQAGMDVILVGVKDHIFKQFEDLKVIPQTLPEEKAYNSIRSGLKYLKNQLADEL